MVARAGGPVRDAPQPLRAGYDTDHDPHDEMGRLYTPAIPVFEKLLFYRPETRRAVWAIAKVKELIQTLY